MSTWKRTLYALWAAQFLTVVGFNLRNPFLPFFLEDLGIENFDQRAIWTGFIIGAAGAMMAVAAPIWGVLADKYGRRMMVLRAMFAGAATISLMALATGPWQLLGLRLIEGGMSGTVAASMTLIAATVPKERIGYAMGLIQMAIFSGTSIGPLIGGVLADQIGFRATFAVAGLLLFAAGMIVVTNVTEHFKRPEPKTEEEKKNGKSTWAIIAGGSMLAMLLVLLVARVGQTAIQPLAPLFVGELGAGDSSATFAGIALGTMGIASAISSVIFGRLSDRMGQRTILILSVFLGGLLFIPQAFAQTPIQFVVTIGLFGVALGGLMPTASAVIANLAPPERRGVVYGFTNTAMSIGAFIGPVGGGFVAASIDIRFAFIFLGILLLVTSLWVWYVVPKSIDRRRHAISAADD